MWSLILVSCCLYILICLLAYNPHNISEMHFPTPVAKHKIGGTGDYIAYWLFFLLGMGAYLVPVFGTSLLWWKKLNRISTHYTYTLLISTTFVYWLLILLAFADIKQSNIMPSYGGIIGLSGVLLLKKYLGKTAFSLTLLMGLGVLTWGIFTLLERKTIDGKKKRAKQAKKEPREA